MRPSSSPSDQHPFGGLLDQLSGSPTVDVALTDVAWLQAALDFERALVVAAARAGMAPPQAAAAIAEACDVRRYDVGELGRLARLSGNPVAPLVTALSAAVPDEARPFVHLGATSQDVMDTAMCLVAHRALGPLIADLESAADTLRDLADRHRATVIPARTLLQHAVPTTFGLKCAGWLVALDEVRIELGRVRESRLAVQLGGAGGTLAALDDAGLAVLAHLAEELGLAEPVIPWHTDRNAVGRLAAALGLTAATLGKISLDVVLLAQTEVGEVAEGGVGRGGSSTLPQKRNPVGAVLARAASQRAPGLVATLLAAGVQEHERAAGAWHAEWETMRDLLHLVGGAAAQVHDLVAELIVDEERARANLDATRGLIMAEAVATRLARTMGRTTAHGVVQRCCTAATAQGRDLGDVLRGDVDVLAVLSSSELDALLVPESYLGAADELVDRALRAHQGHETWPG